MNDTYHIILTQYYLANDPDSIVFYLNNVNGQPNANVLTISKLLFPTWDAVSPLVKKRIDKIYPCNTICTSAMDDPYCIILT